MRQPGRHRSADPRRCRLAQFAAGRRAGEHRAPATAALRPGTELRRKHHRRCPAAQDMFREWMTEIQTEARSGKLPSVLESHLLKMPKTVAALALIFELVDGGRGAIGSVAAARALDWADYLRSHAIRLYSAGSVMAENGARLIIERRAQLPESFTARDVQRKEWAGLADRDAVCDCNRIACRLWHLPRSTFDSFFPP